VTFRGGLARPLLSHWSRAGDALLYLDQKGGAGTLSDVLKIRRE